MCGRRIKSILLAIVVTTLYSACAFAADADNLCADVGARIKLLASKHTNGVVIHGDATTYYAYSLRPPRGYRAVLAFTEAPGEETITVEIFESVRGTQRLTLLTDAAADGTLDFSYVAMAHTIEDAFALIKNGRGTEQRPARFLSIYNQLLDDLRRETPLESASR